VTSTTIAASAAAGHTKRPVTFTNTAPYFIALFLLALVVFWPSYLSTPSTATGYTHFHVVTAASWMLNRGLTFYAGQVRGGRSRLRCSRSGSSSDAFLEQPGAIHCRTRLPTPSTSSGQVPSTST
jgi:hypothetical protein